MKLAMLVNNLEVSGGYQKLVIRLAQELQKQGHAVIVYTPKVDAANCYPKDIKTIDIVSLDKEQASTTPLEAYSHLVKKVDAEVEAVIIHDELSLLGVALLKLPAYCKVVWMLNNQLPENLKKYKTEIVNVHRQTVGPQKVKLIEARKAAQRVKMLRRGLRRVDVFATYDEFNKNLVNKVLGRKQAVVVSAGADLERFKAYAKTRTFKAKVSYTVLSVGVLFRHRRYEDLITAIGILSQKRQDVKAIIVGRQDLAPEYFQSLEKLSRELGVDQLVELKNYVTDEEMVQLYKNSDAFAFINDGFTWGISVFEAVAAHLPVVITNNIGAADLVKAGQTGWVVNPQSPDEVARVIEHIVDNPAEAQVIAERADTELSAFVSWEAYTKRMLHLIEERI
jgi:glycosyltransferase involved in cell wall biosynthesis